MKKILIVDTNFIVMNKKRINQIFLDENSNSHVYITRVSIDERIGQEYRDLKKIYDEIANVENKYSGIAKVEIAIDFDEMFEKKAVKMRNAYEKVCENKIIEMPCNKELFDCVLDRAYKKIAPFIAEATSDKGFKDTVMWLSIIDFFKKNTVDAEIYFFTDDKGFNEKNRTEILYKEFQTETGKNITILDNNKFNEMFEINEEAKNTDIISDEESILSSDSKVHHFEEIPKEIKRKIRADLDRILNNILEMEDNDPYSPYDTTNRYIIRTIIDDDNIEEIFNGLEEFAFTNSLSYNVSFVEYLKKFGVVAEEFARLNIEDIEDLSELYIEISTHYIELQPLLFTTTKDRFNYFYKELKTNYSDDGDLPF